MTLSLEYKKNTFNDFCQVLRRKTLLVIMFICLFAAAVVVGVFIRMSLLMFDLENWQAQISRKNRNCFIKLIGWPGPNLLVQSNIHLSIHKSNTVSKVFYMDDENFSRWIVKVVSKLHGIGLRWKNIHARRCHLNSDLRSGFVLSAGLLS